MGNRRSGAAVVPKSLLVLLLFLLCTPRAARDPILSTQRIRKVKISMVGIYKVKVRLHYLALAHVSHFFSEREPWALKQSTRFAVFVISENSSSSAVHLPLAPAPRFFQLFAALALAKTSSFSSLGAPPHIFTEQRR